MTDPVSPSLLALLTQLREAARDDPSGPAATTLRSLGPWLKAHAASFPCLRCPHAVVLITGDALRLGACKKFVAFPRDDDEKPGSALIAMWCTASLEPADGVGGGWDDLPQHLAQAAGGEAEREQGRPQERGRGG